jgi:hypothetical protein
MKKEYTKLELKEEKLETNDFAESSISAEALGDNPYHWLSEWE